MTDPVSVRVRDCTCPDAIHGEEGDVVYVAPTPSLDCGIQAELDIEAATKENTTEQAVSDAMRRKWLSTFVRYGAIGWNLVGPDGPIPFDVGVLMADYGLARGVAEKVGDLYLPVVLAPFQTRLDAISRNGRTTASTSPRVQSIHSRRARSSRATSAASKRSVG